MSVLPGQTPSVTVLPESIPELLPESIPESIPELLPESIPESLPGQTPSVPNGEKGSEGLAKMETRQRSEKILMSVLCAIFLTTAAIKAISR